ncbi:hypothetical protein [Bradyrhizobium sp. TM239]|uniref:hypothetical protein n=1 Tax=Bradyrhizobium sp. TM239 TaxID=2599802 RepID=UPI0027D6B906|nr:hypothetical protein TM239_01970 [Bradyrhizobium sp. TM239]
MPFNGAGTDDTISRESERGLVEWGHFVAAFIRQQLADTCIAKISSFPFMRWFKRKDG